MNERMAPVFNGTTSFSLLRRTGTRIDDVFADFMRLDDETSSEFRALTIMRLVTGLTRVVLVFFGQSLT